MFYYDILQLKDLHTVDVLVKKFYSRKNTTLHDLETTIALKAILRSKLKTKLAKV